MARRPCGAEMRHPTSGPKRAKQRWVEYVAALGLAVAASCGVDRGDLGFVSERAAFVHCVVAGPSPKVPRLADSVPTLPIPSGLYTQELSPVALLKIGFAEDAVVCASLESMSESDLVAAAGTIDGLLSMRNEVDSAVSRDGGACACAAAGKLRRQRWLPSCAEREATTACELDAATIDRVRKQFEPLEQALDRAVMPVTHWRLFGRTDRAGQLKARVPQMVGLHRGGSTVFLPGQPVPERLNHLAIMRLLQEPSVAAVIRQDSGRALVVIREIDDLLVFDAFIHPDVSSENHPLLAEFDNRHVERYIEALARPAASKKLAFDPGKGLTWIFDHTALERVDAARVIGTSLADRRYRGDQTHAVPPGWFARVDVQVPFDDDGIEARLALSDDGQIWVRELESAPVSPSLSELGVSNESPVFAPRGTPPRFVLRGTPIETVVFAGFHALPALLASIEMEYPSSLKGSTDSFAIDIPTGPLPGDRPTRDGLAPLRERLSLEPYALTVKISASKAAVDLSLTRR